MSAIINSFGTLYEPIKIDEEGNVTLHDPYGYGKRKTGLDGSGAGRVTLPFETFDASWKSTPAAGDVAILKDLLHDGPDGRLLRGSVQRGDVDPTLGHPLKGPQLKGLDLEPRQWAQLRRRA